MLVKQIRDRGQISDDVREGEQIIIPTHPSCQTKLRSYIQGINFSYYFCLYKIMQTLTVKTNMKIDRKLCRGDVFSGKRLFILFIEILYTDCLKLNNQDEYGSCFLFSCIAFFPRSFFFFFCSFRACFLNAL